MSLDPITLIGAALGAVGSIMSGMASAAAANKQAQIAEMNSEVALENADRAINTSQVNAQDQDMMTLAFLGQQENAQAASGLTGRSQILARKSARELGRKDALNVRQGGEIEAYNFKVEAANQEASAELYRQQAGYSMLSGFLGAAQSLVGGFSGSSGTSSPAIGRSTFAPRPAAYPSFRQPSLVR